MSISKMILLLTLYSCPGTIDHISAHVQSVSSQQSEYQISTPADKDSYVSLSLSSLNNKTLCENINVQSE